MRVANVDPFLKRRYPTVAGENAPNALPAAVAGTVLEREAVT